MKELKVLELFGGIGAPRKALTRLGIDFKVVDYVEIDKYAVKSYNALYNENYEPQDVTQWNKDIEIDLIFHGSPCQDFSIAGNGKGGDEGSGTRSSLLYETVRIVEKTKPKYVIWENVKAVINKNHKHNFDNYLEKMEELGYTNYYQVLNAKDYGIPQNRERVFTISILKNKDFTFPLKQTLNLRLKDVLETEVDPKYYLTDKMINYVLDMNDVQKGTKWDNRANNGVLNKEIALTIGVRSDEAQRGGVTNFVIDNLDKEIKVKEYKSYISWEDKKGRINTQDHRAFKDDMYSGTVPSMERGIPKVLIKNATKKGYIEACDGDGIDLPYPDSETRRGRVQKQRSHTITTSDNLGVTKDMRIRKLTPLECWRLMGFGDEDFYKAQKVNSNSQLYKQAGNSIVVNVLEAIFTNLLKENR